MKDLCLKEFLSSRGFEGEGAERALAELCRCGLTRPGKVRIAESKRQRVDEVLAAAFVRVCLKPACKRHAARHSREPVAVSAEHCEVCTGSDNRRAVDEMVEAMRRAGMTKLLVVGGSPGTRSDLEGLLGGRCELRFVTKETNPRRKVIEPMHVWSDITAIWLSTEISHKATATLSGPKVVRVSRRGVAALAKDVRDRCRPRAQ